jgi:4'-phosphopantetheinyl transferase
MWATHSPTPLSSDLKPGMQEVHVWLVDLNVGDAAFQEGGAGLSVEENVRASRYRSSADRKNFVTSRAVLRDILSRYIEQAPVNMIFGYSAEGKPFLRNQSGGREITFNVSHSDDLAIYAVSCVKEVGIDLERVESFDDREGVARRFFSARELAVFRASGETGQTEVFFRLWTRKEAYLKARGLGLTQEGRGFDARLQRGQAAKMVDENGVQWRAEELLPAPGYLAAVVAKGGDWHLRLFSWTASKNSRMRSGSVRSAPSQEHPRRSSVKVLS